MKLQTLQIAAGLTVVALLGACAQDMSATVSSGAPTPADQACLRDVATTTNNPQVVVLESYFSEAGTEVTVGVGPDQARWRCIAYADGTTDGIMSLTDEGAL